ncbi:unnamed protein product [Phytomonas sp. EM1]|nr:unnamed protein product [Phytomonas sp. EM1]|eukprot:CCW59782.1 unnamed protein product [Phytomonas sp. isolate EM1]
MQKISCPHCTFLNEPNRLKCTMCLRYLRKRERTSLGLSGDGEISSAAPPPSLPPPASVLSLFSTASGKAIQISDAALQKARAKFAFFEPDRMHGEGEEGGEKETPTAREKDDGIEGKNAEGAALPDLVEPLTRDLPPSQPEPPP